MGPEESETIQKWWFCLIFDGVDFVSCKEILLACHDFWESDLFRNAVSTEQPIQIQTDIY